MIFEDAKDVCERFGKKCHEPCEMFIDRSGNGEMYLVLMYDTRGNLYKVREECFFLYDSTPMCRLHEGSCADDFYNSAEMPDGTIVSNSDEWYVRFPKQDGHVDMPLDELGPCQKFIEDWIKRGSHVDKV